MAVMTSQPANRIMTRRNTEGKNFRVRFFLVAAEWQNTCLLLADTFLLLSTHPARGGGPQRTDFIFSFFPSPRSSSVLHLGMLGGEAAVVDPKACCSTISHVNTQ